MVEVDKNVGGKCGKGNLQDVHEWQVVASTITCKSATCLVNDLESHYIATTNVFQCHGTPTAKRERRA